jgi:hypothetical protein
MDSRRQKQYVPFEVNNKQILDSLFSDILSVCVSVANRKSVFFATDSHTDETDKSRSTTRPNSLDLSLSSALVRVRLWLTSLGVSSLCHGPATDQKQTSPFS